MTTSSVSIAREQQQQQQQQQLEQQLSQAELLASNFSVARKICLRDCHRVCVSRASLAC